MRLCSALFGLFCSVLLVSCGKHDDLAIQRLDKQLFDAKSADSVRAFLNRNPAVAQLYFNANGAGTDTALVSELTNRISNPALNELYRQVQIELGDLTDINTQLSEAFANIKKDFPDFRTPQVATVMTGFLGPDLLVTDSLIVIGLDYFVGPKARFRPQGAQYPQYILRRYQKEYIVPADRKSVV